MGIMEKIEVLEISNFGGIKAEILEFSRVNIFIGPQASGKSIVAKLLYYFKNIIRSILLDVEEKSSKPNIRSSHIERFLKYFPANNWPDGHFYIKYSVGDINLIVERRYDHSESINIDYSDTYDELIRFCRALLRKNKPAITDNDAAEPSDWRFTRRYNDVSLTLMDKIATVTHEIIANRNVFIPAGRSFFSTLRSSVFRFISGNIGIDPFLAEFGSAYENARDDYFGNGQKRLNPFIMQKFNSIISGKYIKENDDFFIRCNDGRRVRVENSSSGQQEIIPLGLTIFRLLRQVVINTKVIPGKNPELQREWRTLSTTLFVEEPEAHLYPTAQRDIVQLLAYVIDFQPRRSQLIMTTHSPYVLTVINNLIIANKIISIHPERRDEVLSITKDALGLDGDRVQAYYFDTNGIKSIIDSETVMINADIMDSVSGELLDEYRSLMDIYFR